MEVWTSSNGPEYAGVHMQSTFSTVNRLAGYQFVSNKAQDCSGQRIRSSQKPHHCQTAPFASSRSLLLQFLVGTARAKPARKNPEPLHLI